MAILPDDVRNKQDRDRRAARAAAGLAARARPRGQRRVGVERVIGSTGRSIQPVVRTSCLCGCGEMPRGRHSRFLPGHDMRHRARR